MTLPKQPHSPPPPGQASEPYIERQIDMANRLAGHLLREVGRFHDEHSELDEIGMVSGIGLMLDRIEYTYPAVASLLAGRIAAAYAGKPAPEPGTQSRVYPVVSVPDDPKKMH